MEVQRDFDSGAVLSPAAVSAPKVPLGANGTSSTMPYEYDPPPAVFVISTIGITFGVLSILLNLIFLCATRFLNQKSTAYNRFMVNLSVSDVMSSLTFLLIHNWPEGPFASIDTSHAFSLVQALPYVFRSTPWMFLTSYLLTLTCLTSNQYVAVCKPWRYSELVTRKMVTVSLVVIWLLSSLQVLVPLVVLITLSCLHDRLEAAHRLALVSMVEMQVWMAFFAVSTIFNIALNIIVYRKIRKLKLKRRCAHMSNPEITNIKMKQNAFVTVSLLLIVCLFCRLPFPLIGIVGISFVTNRSNLDVYVVLNASIILLLYLNCFLDPIIYMIRSKELRKGYKILKSNCCKGQLDNDVFANSASMRLMSLRMEASQNTVMETDTGRRESSPPVNM